MQKLRTPIKNMNIASRIDAADVLRAVAVVGIVVMHAAGNFTVLDWRASEAPDGSWMQFLNRAVWGSLTFLFEGKGYAVFALLFGFSFYVQESRQRAMGKDFRLRFLWRLLLLAVIGFVDTAFYYGDILVFLAVMGVILPLVCRLPDKVLLWMAIFLLLQPWEWWKLGHASIDPAYVFNPGELFAAQYGELHPVLVGGTFWETVWANLKTGRWVCMNWYITDGRVTQTAALLMIGLLVGRKGLLLDGEKNRALWSVTLVAAAAVYFSTTALRGLFPAVVENPNVMQPLELILRSWGNMAVAFGLSAAVSILFYTTGLRRPLTALAPYGRMSLTAYVSQSILGAALYYHWGFGLWDDLGFAASALVGAGIVACQILFSRRWLKTHKQGPVEWAWKKATWV